MLGFLCNLLVRPVADKYFMTDAELAAEQALGHDKGADASTSLEWKAAPGTKPLAIAAWLVVGIPLAWGVWVTLQKTAYEILSGLVGSEMCIRDSLRHHAVHPRGPAGAGFHLQPAGASGG